MSNGDTSVGEALRVAREKKKLTVEQVHAETKISVEVLDALEQDDFGSFESEIYLKGFLRNYAQFLGLDPEGLWSRLSRKQGDSKEPAGGAYWDVEEAVHEERLTSPRIFKRFVLPIMIVVIVVLALLLIREHRKVKSLTTGATGHNVTVEVMTIAADV